MRIKELINILRAEVDRGGDEDVEVSFFVVLPDRQGDMVYRDLRPTGYYNCMPGKRFDIELEKET